jgi:hypothetical protein
MLRHNIGEFVLVIGAITNMIVNKNIGIYLWNISTKLLVFWYLIWWKSLIQIIVSGVATKIFWSILIGSWSRISV